MAASEPVAATRIVTAAGISLLSFGTPDLAAPPIVMLHGIGGAADSFTDAATALAVEGHHCVSWDAPGYGESADPQGPVDHVAAVLEVLDHLGARTAILAGTSWGGVIACRTALEHPDRVAALVIADSTRGSGIDPDRSAAMRARADELDELGAAEFAARRGPRLVSPEATDVAREAVIATMAGVRNPGYRAAAEFMASSNTGDRLAEIDCPTLVVVGADDVITGVPESELIARSIPGASFTLLPGAGHAAISETPQAFVAAVTEFLEAS